MDFNQSDKRSGSKLGVNGKDLDFEINFHQTENLAKMKRVKISGKPDQVLTLILFSFFIDKYLGKIKLEKSLNIRKLNIASKPSENKLNISEKQNEKYKPFFQEQCGSCRFVTRSLQFIHWMAALVSTTA